MSWALWLGIISPFAVVHGISWVVLLLTPFLCRHPESGSSSPQLLRGGGGGSKGAWHRDSLAIGLVIFLFDLSWGTQLTSALLPNRHHINTILQSIFLVSSVSLGFGVLVYFCFLQSKVVFHIRNRRVSPGNGGDNDDGAPAVTDPVTTRSSDISFEVVAVPLPKSLQGEESEVVNKQADL